MNYFHQVIIVTFWEYKRFFKPKNEVLGVVVMLLASMIFYFGTRYAMSDQDEKPALYVFQNLDSQLIDKLMPGFNVELISPEDESSVLDEIVLKRKGQLLLVNDQGFVLHAYKKNKDVIRGLRTVLDNYDRSMAMDSLGLSKANLDYLLKPSSIVESYVYSGNSRNRVLLAIFFASLMLLAVFLSFAYQFTAITGEKQLRITEQIVSAIKPQVWMDGKIFGITLTGLSSMAIYSLIGIVGGTLYFQFTDMPVSGILDYLYLPSILLYLPFALTGILIWNAILAAVASAITDPNNSGKSSLMMMPVLFVLASFLVIRNPDSSMAIFLSWFPLTSATSMPMRWAITEVGVWQLIGSFVLLATTFYLLRKLAAKIFRVSILISGKEPTWAEIIRLSKET
ncbi:MAG: ABC transporter permease [Bacteroidales bacterium]|nr:ABC transporter permease [Bacteroidales bacterium]